MEVLKEKCNKHIYKLHPYHNKVKNVTVFTLFSFKTIYPLKEVADAMSSPKYYNMHLLRGRGRKQ